MSVPTKMVLARKWNLARWNSGMSTDEADNKFSIIVGQRIIPTGKGVLCEPYTGTEPGNPVRSELGVWPRLYIGYELTANMALFLTRVNTEYFELF